MQSGNNLGWADKKKSLNRKFTVYPYRIETLLCVPFKSSNQVDGFHCKLSAVTILSIVSIINRSPRKFIYMVNYEDICIVFFP